ncbi:MAG TPA: hypothetical protein VGV12_09025 [Gemmatimonadales bacterium]|nr:hypothetical protein [Gemmatimonadales bacterium]
MTTSHSALRILLFVIIASRAEAQVDPSAPWRTLHTPHFRIHFLPAYRAVALVEAREAERSYRLLATELHPPRGIVDITLADDIDASNGFTSVVPSNRITIFAAPPAGDHGLLFFDSWLRLVTTHELAHVFHLDRTKGIWSPLQHVFGRAPGLFPNEYQPSWVVEGLATYYESKFTNGGRVRGSFHTQLLEADQAAGAGGGASRSPWDATLFTRWADGLVPYAYGSRFLHYLAGTAGDSVVPHLVEATSAQLIPFRVGRQVSRVAPGRSLAEEWRRGTQPAPETRAADALPPPARVIDSLLRTEPVPRVSPDGRRVAYVRDDGKGASELRVIDAATFRTLAAHQVNGGVDYDWVGDTLVVAQLDFTSRWRLRSDLYRWVPATGAWRRATYGARLVAPAGGGGRLAAITLGPASGQPTVPTPADSGGSQVVWTDLALSPDGRWVAGIRSAEGRWSLMLWPATDPRAAVALLETRGSIADVVWKPDGELWFVADPTGLPQVYRWTDSAAVQPLTAERLGARAPAPLEDGGLLYAGLTARGWELRRTAAGASARSGTVTFAAPLPFDSAPSPAVAVRETGYSLWPSLRPHFWLPVFQDEGSTGRFGGALIAGADVVGRYAYAADLLFSPQRSRLGGDVVLVASRLGNPVFDLSASSSWGDLGPLAVPNVTLSELDQAAALGASFLTLRWRGVTSLRLAAEVERTEFASVPDTSLATVCAGCGRQDVYGGSATLTVSRLVAGAVSVSPEDGFAWSGTYRRREEEGTTRWSNELRSRVALYAHVPGLGGFAHHVLALRIFAGATNGPLGTLFRVGGVTPQGVNIFFPVSLTASRAFPLRGYADGEVRGERAVAGSVEYRLPLALVGRAIGHLPVGVDRLWLNAFTDAGDAWAPGVSPRLTRLWSAGLEVAGAVTMGYDFPLSVRLGVAEPLANPPSGVARRPQVYAALASDF